MNDKNNISNDELIKAYNERKTNANYCQLSKIIKEIQSNMKIEVGNDLIKNNIFYKSTNPHEQISTKQSSHIIEYTTKTGINNETFTNYEIKTNKGLVPKKIYLGGEKLVEKLENPLYLDALLDILINNFRIKKFWFDIDYTKKEYQQNYKAHFPYISKTIFSKFIKNEKELNDFEKSWYGILDYKRSDVIGFPGFETALSQNETKYYMEINDENGLVGTKKQLKRYNKRHVMKEMKKNEISEEWKITLRKIKKKIKKIKKIKNQD